MSFHNSYASFLYRQLFVHPPKAPSSTTLDGKVGFATGANTGLGYYASAQMLSLGLSHLILAVRNLSKGEAARKNLLSALPTSAKPPPVVEVWELDLADYKSIVSFVERLKQSNLTIDFAILNAGVVDFKYTVNPTTSHENSIQINWLSNALLTLLLLPALDRQAKVDPNRPRPVISIVGSEVAAWAKFKEAKISAKSGLSLLEALDDRKNFDMTDRYSTSKLLQQLFFLELVNNNRSDENRSSGAVLNIVNPGLCSGTELHRTAEGAVAVILGTMKRVIGRSTSMGARTLVHGAVLAGPQSNGKYLNDCHPDPFAGYENRKNGLATQRKAWDEMVAEFKQVVNMEDLLAAI